MPNAPADKYKAMEEELAALKEMVAANLPKPSVAAAPVATDATNIPTNEPVVERVLDEEMIEKKLDDADLRRHRAEAGLRKDFDTKINEMKLEANGSLQHAVRAMGEEVNKSLKILKDEFTVELNNILLQS